MKEKLVKDYYTGYVQKEWRRLSRDPYHRLEFDTTWYIMQRYLPRAGHVLDAGGGPGRYTLELARRGYDVTLLDMTPANLEFAKRRINRSGVRANVKAVIEGSIVDLSRFADGTFDAVVCTGGPLSHVVDARRRDRAIGELIRVAKPGAPIFVSVMSRLSLMVVELTLFPHEIEQPLFKKIRDTGTYLGGYGFTACHFYLPEEFRAAFEAHGVDVLTMAGVEGISSNHVKAFNRLAKHPRRLKTWLETHYRTCEHPSVVGVSEHMLIACRRPA